jgi:nucleoside-diphosphate-sugar epimerase
VKGTLWITGVGGFTGSHLLDYLTGLPDRPQLVGIDLGPTGPVGLDDYHVLDLNNVDGMIVLARSNSPQWVIHLAGVMPPAEPAAMWQANVGGTAGLMLALNRAKCHQTRVVTIGSAAEYRFDSAEPVTEDQACGGVSEYGLSKWVQGMTALSTGQKFGIPTCVVRAFNLLGPRLPDRLVTAWLCRQFAGPVAAAEVVIGNLDSARDFIDIRDAVSAYWQVAINGEPGEEYNVCSGVPTSVRSVVALLSEITGHRPTIRVDPRRVRPTDPPVAYGTYAKLQAATGWRPTLSLRQSLADMLKQF